MQCWAILILCFFPNVSIGKSRAARDAAAAWSYSDPTTWAQSYSTCGGTLQTPVNIVYNDAVLDTNLGEVKFIMKGGGLTGQQYNVQNNGHSISISFPLGLWDLELSSAPAGKFEVNSMHFHWGSSNNLGSEHTKDNKRYAMETHIVCFNKDMYGNFETAKASPGGLAVVGIFHEVDDSVEKSKTQIGILGELETVMAQVLTVSQDNVISAFDLTAILKQINPRNYFRYPGSLTTPPCTENVIWTVMDAAVKIKPQQLELFRKQTFTDKTKMADNYRPVQPLNSQRSFWKRTIYRSWNASKPLQYSTFTVFSLIFALICRYYASG